MARLDRQPASKDLTTLELPLCRRAPRVDVPLDVALRPKSFHGALMLCCQLSGLEEKEISLPLRIDAAQWSRICQGTAHFPPNKLVPLMDLCGNEVPLLWLAHSRGYGLVMLKSEAERRAEAAETEAEELRKRVAWLEGMFTRRSAA